MSKAQVFTFQGVAMAIVNTHFGAKEISRLLKDVKSVYFIGIGGINMSSLAHITHLRGYTVGGSDRTPTALTEKLAAAGIEINYEHNKENVKGYDAIVYTVAISEDNEEYVEALRHGIPCISRADYLGYIMTGYKNRIGVSGMHGKSTCTSMCAELFIEADADPTVLSGAELERMGGAYRVGKEVHFIFEACEYMDSFLDFNPNIAVILNVEMDHVDYFHSLDQVKNSYRAYAALTGKDGFAVANLDDENVLSALSDYNGTLVGFGIENKSADFCAKNIENVGGLYRFDVTKKGEYFCHIDLSVSGYHNIYNALASVAAADICGIASCDIERGLHTFRGAKRRMELKGRIDGADIYDDYGHHPTEVRSTLEGAAKLAHARGARLICAFQPHTYTRTKEFIDDFARAFDAADKVLCVDIYAARETDTLGVSSSLLASLIGERAEYTGGFFETAEAVLREISAGDVVIIMGAGDIYKVFEHLKEKYN